MKTLTFAVFIAAFAALPGSALHSQTPAPAKSPLQQLQEIRDKNKAQIEKQGAALQKLDALQQDSTQLKFLGKRT